MTAYEEVNAAVNEIFFLSGRSGNQPVYLDIEDDVRGVLSDRLSVEPSPDFSNPSWRCVKWS